MATESTTDASGTRSATAALGQTDAGRCYVLVFETGTTRLVHLLASGESRIGTEEDALVRLDSEAVRPRHAAIVTTRSEAVLTASGPDAEVRVNGDLLTGSHVLTSGDVIAVGDAVLGFHRNATAVLPRVALGLELFRSRLEEEIERALRYQNPAALFVIDPGSEGSAPLREVVDVVCRVVRRVDVVGVTGRAEVAVLFPQTAHAASIPATRLLQAIQRQSPHARGGIAVCPEDGCTPDTLLTGARVAMRAARSGTVGQVSSAAHTFELGDVSVVAVDPMMKGLFTLVRRLAASDLAVLVQGETGAGKEIVAQALHGWSPRQKKRMVAINCAALPESLLDSELFGHERGAFTGAAGAKAGLFETASGGTIFLDEVGECSPMTQAKLLRVLETRRVSRVGGLEERAVDVRVVSATNRSLEDEITAGRFRRDLYFRLNAATVIVPSLRDRPLDIPVLARRFLDDACARLPRDPMTITSNAMQRLVLHAWPGNVRELKNTMDFLAASVAEPELSASQLPETIAATVAPWMRPKSVPEATTSGVRDVNAPRNGGPAAGQFRSIYDEIAELEKRRMQEALEAAGGVRVRAAELIGMPLRTFVTKLKVYGLAVGGGGTPGSESHERS